MSNESAETSTAAAAGYAIAGIIMIILPTFLVTGFPLQFESAKHVVASVSMASGLLVIGAAALHVAGDERGLARGVGAFGGLLFVASIVLIFVV